MGPTPYKLSWAESWEQGSFPQKNPGVVIRREIHGWYTAKKKVDAHYVKSYPPDTKVSGDRDRLLYFFGSSTIPRYLISTHWLIN